VIGVVLGLGHFELFFTLLKIGSKTGATTKGVCKQKTQLLSNDDKTQDQEHDA
jgi:hypothetical protein